MTSVSSRMVEPAPIQIPAGRQVLRGDLTVPPGARSIVIFAHGSGSGRLSPRNRFVAETLQRGGLATLLLDLLTEREELREQAGATLRFDVELLAERLDFASEWAQSGRRETRDPRQGYLLSRLDCLRLLSCSVQQPEQKHLQLVGASGAVRSHVR